MIKGLKKGFFLKIIVYNSFIPLVPNRKIYILRISIGYTEDIELREHEKEGSH